MTEYSVIFWKSLITYLKLQNLFLMKFYLLLFSILGSERQNNINSSLNNAFYTYWALIYLVDWNLTEYSAI